jgi:glycosyltransferase involved in cell wall biosynthesis
VEVVPSDAGPDLSVDIMLHATATLFPIAWSEPFGMVMIESMACGTPVLAPPMGSVPEVVADGVTGFWCETPEAMAAAVSDLADISPEDCRHRVADLFSKSRMTEGYERIFRAVAEERRALADSRVRVGASA